MGIFSKRKDKLNPNSIKSREVNIPTTSDNKPTNSGKLTMRDMEGPHGYRVSVTGIKRHGDE